MALATFQNGDGETGAINTLVALTKAHPEFKEAHFALGSLDAHESRLENAAAEYAEVIRLDPNDDEELLDLVKALATSGAYRGSASAGRRVHEAQAA